MRPEFGKPIDLPPGAAHRIVVMYVAYGYKVGEHCGDCVHLITKSYANNYFKCDLSKQTNGPGTDWRKRWDACGRWERKP